MTPFLSFNCLDGTTQYLMLTALTASEEKSNITCTYQFSEPNLGGGLRVTFKKSSLMVQFSDNAELTIKEQEHFAEQLDDQIKAGIQQYGRVTLNDNTFDLCQVDVSGDSDAKLLSYKCDYHSLTGDEAFQVTFLIKGGEIKTGLNVNGAFDRSDISPEDTEAFYQTMVSRMLLTIGASEHSRTEGGPEPVCFTEPSPTIH